MIEILNAVESKYLTVDEGVDLLLQFNSNYKESNIRSVLKMLVARIFTIDKAEVMITKLCTQNNSAVQNDSQTNNSYNNSSLKYMNLKNNNGPKTRRAARPLEKEEYEEILRLCQSGFIYKDGDKTRIFRPNNQLAMTFLLQANLGLRISDVLKLKPATFKNEKLEIIEKKTGKLQYRAINVKLKNLIYEYALEKPIKSNEALINLGRSGIHKQLQIISDYLGLSSVSSHSFRKFFAMTVYRDSNGDIELVKELLNHSSLATTQKYIKLSQAEINKASADIDLMGPWENNNIHNKV
ncbi:MAG: tyrosine-type recombinase/integrase [Clostridium sp.]